MPGQRSRGGQMVAQAESQRSRAGDYCQAGPPAQRGRHRAARQAQSGKTIFAIRLLCLLPRLGRATQGNATQRQARRPLAGALRRARVLESASWSQRPRACIRERWPVTRQGRLECQWADEGRRGRANLRRLVIVFGGAAARGAAKLAFRIPEVKVCRFLTRAGHRAAPRAAPRAALRTAAGAKAGRGRWKLWKLQCRTEIQFYGSGR